MNRITSAENGKKGGRPYASKYVSCFIIPGINTVVLTKRQYDTLKEKFGKELLQKALLILDNWLCTSPVGIKHKGKNNYAYFRTDGWVINEARNFIT